MLESFVVSRTFRDVKARVHVTAKPGEPVEADVMVTTDGVS